MSKAKELEKIQKMVSDGNITNEEYEQLRRKIHSETPKLKYPSIFNVTKIPTTVTTGWSWYKETIMNLEIILESKERFKIVSEDNTETQILKNQISAITKETINAHYGNAKINLIHFWAMISGLVLVIMGHWIYLASKVVIGLYPNGLLQSFDVYTAPNIFNAILSFPLYLLILWIIRLISKRNPNKNMIVKIFHPNGNIIFFFLYNEERVNEANKVYETLNKYLIS
jgi:hypothetical protein